GRGHQRLDRGPRPGAGAPRPVAGRHRADPDAARAPRRDVDRPRRRPRADARGRLRGAGRRSMRNIRLVVVGLRLQVKMLARSSFNGILGILYPLFFTTVAFFMYQAGAKNALPLAALGAAVMGIWSAVST